MRLGLVQNTPARAGRLQRDDSDPDDFEDWQDIEDDDNNNKADTDDEDITDGYKFDTERRSSVDMDTLSINAHDVEAAGAAASSAAFPFVNQDYDNPNKRQRSKKPMVASISEEAEEVATVDGNADGDDMDDD
jgi:hypothetical protein